MTNIKYLKENNLYEAHKHFMQIAEGYLQPSELQEAEGDDPNAQQDPNMMGGDPNMMGGDPNAMGGAPGADPNMAGGAPGGDPNAMGGDPNMMGADPNAMGQPMPDASDPIGGDDMGGEDPFADQRTDDNGAGGEDGDTIDIEGLTHAEEKLNVKQNQIGRDLAKVDTKISTLIDKIAGLQTALDSNSSELENLKAEFEKRNPTQTEKLDVRGALDSYPFNVRPDDFWANKMKERNNYEVYADNDESTEDQYAITADDIEDLPSEISKTFSINDDDIQTLEKMFKL
jgi:hypothetical protein